MKIIKQVEKLISNKDFILWARNKSEVENKDSSWNKWLANHAQHAEAFKVAKEFALRVSFQEHIPTEKVKSSILKNILEKNRTTHLETTLPNLKVIWIRRITSAAAAILLLFGIGLGIKKTFENVSLNRNWVTVESPLGKRTQLTLPDSSQVWLNAGTKIEYLINSQTEERLVKLLGEAYFEVNKGQRPFKVTTGQLTTEVLGTSFNINAYNQTIEVALVEGKVNVSDGNQNLDISPKEMAVYSAVLPYKLIKENFDPKTKVAWKDGQLIFVKASFLEVIERLEKWYDIKIIYNENDIPEWQYNGLFENKSLELVLRSVFFYQDFDYQITNSTITLTPMK